jgi:hypothetical protein
MTTWKKNTSGGFEVPGSEVTQMSLIKIERSRPPPWLRSSSAFFSFEESRLDSRSSLLQQDSTKNTILFLFSQNVLLNAENL